MRQGKGFNTWEGKEIKFKLYNIYSMMAIQV